VSDLSGALAAAARAIEQARRIVAIGHVHPDGDALGSALAVAIAARAAGKEAWVTFGEPFSVPDQFRYLDRDVVVAPDEVPSDIDVVVACDTANPERLGTALAIAERAGTLIVVDHHVSNGGFGDLLVIDPGAAATAQLVYYLIADHLHWPVTVAMATALYTGLVTDTGRFQYSATTPEVHRVAAALLAAGVDPDDVGRHVYGEAPFGYLGVAGAVLVRSRLEPDSRLVWSVLYLRDLEEAGIGGDDTDGLIDLVRLAAEAEVACLLKETETGATKASLRSRGAVDVNALAARFGGGGHHNAAGFTVEESPADVIRRIKELLA
jgi:phosphoesterase RecJ-like protein